MITSIMAATRQIFHLSRCGAKWRQSRQTHQQCLLHMKCLFKHCKLGVGWARVRLSGQLSQRRRPIVVQLASTDANVNMLDPAVLECLCQACSSACKQAALEGSPNIPESEREAKFLASLSRASSTCSPWSSSFGELPAFTSMFLQQYSEQASARA